MITQIAIMIFGASAIWFVSRKEEWKRWGYFLGLLGQPFWIYESYRNEQWGILIMTLFYAYSWTQGIFNYWISTKKKQKTVEVKKSTFKRLERDSLLWNAYTKRESAANIASLNLAAELIEEFDSDD